MYNLKITRARHKAIENWRAFWMTLYINKKKQLNVVLTLLTKHAEHVEYRYEQSVLLWILVAWVS